MATSNTRKALTKGNIEAMATAIMEGLINHSMAEDVAIYYNGRKMVYNSRGQIVDSDGYDPHDYFKYAAYHHILSMSFEGAFYEEINENWYPKWFTKILTKYGVYAELGNSWNLSCYPIDDNMKVQYTEYEEPQEVTYLYLGNWETGSEDEIFQPIMQLWRELAKKVGDVGSCCIGAGFSFIYNNKPYFMSPNSPYQGSISWETDKDKIKAILNVMGCTNIQYHWGNMD